MKKISLALFILSGCVRTLCAAAFCFDDPPGPQFTEGEKQTQREAGARVLPLVRKAFETGADTVTIPPGDYRFAANPGRAIGGGPGYALEFRDMRRDAAHPFRIIARGVTLWFDLPLSQTPRAHFALGFVNCRHIALEGATLDRDPRGNMEGRITRLDTAGKRIEIEPVPGTSIPTAFSGDRNQRLIPFNADGTFCVALYALQRRPGQLKYRDIEPSATPGRYWVHLDEKSELLKVNSDPAWQRVYGDAGTLQPGDGVSLVYTTTRAIGVVDCEAMTFQDLRIYIAKGMPRELGGVGGHQWKHCYLGPRPGTCQWQGAEGFLSGGMERGSLYEGLTVRHTADDVFNINGFWGYIENARGDTIVIQRDHQMPAQPGDKLLFYDRKTGARAGEAVVVAVEGATLRLDRDATPFAAAIAENPRRQCHGWEVRASVFTDCYQRFLVQGGAGGTLRDSTFTRMGASVQLNSNFFTENEGGICRDITIANNVFEDVAIRPGGVALNAGFQPLEGVAREPLLSGLVVRDNTFMHVQYPAVTFDLVAGGAITGNTFHAGYGADTSPSTEPPVRLVNCVDVVTHNNRTNPPPPLMDLPEGVSLRTHPGAPGHWLECRAAEPFSEREFAVGRAPDIECFLANGRIRSSCWMEPSAGETWAALPRETQFLLARLKSGRYLAMIALLDDAFRCGVHGDGAGGLRLLAESGDRSVLTNRVTGLYLEEGNDPYALVRSATARVRAYMRPHEVDAPPRMPDFARHFGWCSWNAFYTDVSHENIRQAMEHFRAGGVPPGFVVVDAGWSPCKDKALSGYDAEPAKFPGGLEPTLRMLKQTYGIRRTLMWQAFNGYWRGVDPVALPDIGARMVTPHIPSWVDTTTTVTTAERDATVTKTFYPNVYRQPIGQPDLGAFYDAFHRRLHAAGADGVKIDAMTWVETLGDGRGGRVRAMRELVEATARSEREWFDHNVIWCSSCSSDCILQAPRSALMRSSGDFFPNKPESHGRHIVINAHGSLWMGEFVIPDWDMFQSGHPAGAFHAAARALSGGPVYVADELGKTDFDLLRKLVLSDRTTPLCAGPARPSPDSLFLDPARDQRLFKIFNRNPAGGHVLGVFHCGYQPGTPVALRGEFGPADAPGLNADTVAVYRHVEGSLRCMRRDETAPVALAPLEFEICTLAPVRDGFAVIGLTDIFNSGGGVAAIRRDGQRVEVDLRDGGEFLAWSARAPQAVQVNGHPHAYTHDADSGALRVRIPRGQAVTVAVE